MKYFHKINNQVFHEMFNIEAGLEIFQSNGIIQDINKAKKYPIYTVDGISIYVKGVVGCIYLAKNEIKDFIKLAAEKLEKLENIAFKNFEYRHLNGFSNVKKIDHFINVKSKNKLCTTNTEFNYHDKLIKRGIYEYTNENDDRPSSYSSIIKNIRFTWFVMDINYLIYQMDTFWREELNFNLQLTSLIIEKNLIFKPDGYIFTDNITFNDFSFSKNLSNLTSFGNLTLDQVKTSIENNEDNYLMCNEMINIPEFIPAWHNLNISISFCKYRYFNVEIYKHLKNTNDSILNSCDIIVELYKKPIYKVNFNEITINNKPEIGNDKCNFCGSLLYDSIYIIFIHTAAVVGAAYCPICIHSYPGTIVLTEFIVIAKTTYPKTLKQILALCNINEQVKQLCLTDIKTLEFNEQAIFVNNKNCLLWGGSISALYKYVNESGYISRKFKTTEKIKQYLENVEIIKINMINPTIIFL